MTAPPEPEPEPEELRGPALARRRRRSWRAASSSAATASARSRSCARPSASTRTRAVRRRLLALTLARDAGFQAPIERLLLDLLEAEPHDNELRYALATYYRKAGMTARAILQLRIVLSADASHAAAWRDLGELEAGPTGPTRRSR